MGLLRGQLDRDGAYLRLELVGRFAWRSWLVLVCIHCTITSCNLPHGGRAVQHEAMVTDEADSSDGRAGMKEECAWRSGLNEERPTTSNVRGGGTVTRSVSDGVQRRRREGSAPHFGQRYSALGAGLDGGGSGGDVRGHRGRPMKATGRRRTRPSQPRTHRWSASRRQRHASTSSRPGPHAGRHPSHLPASAPSQARPSRTPRRARTRSCRRDRPPRRRRGRPPLPHQRPAPRTRHPPAPPPPPPPAPPPPPWPPHYKLRPPPPPAVGALPQPWAVADGAGIRIDQTVFAMAAGSTSIGTLCAASCSKVMPAEGSRS